MPHVNENPDNVLPPPPTGQPMTPPPAPTYAGPVAVRAEPQDRGPFVRHPLTLMTLLLFVGAVGYRWLVLGNVSQWSLFFHGVSAVLALALIAVGPRGSFGDRMFLGTTLALLMASTVAGEGAICVLIAAPFIYLFVFLVAFIGRAAGRGRSMVVAPVLFLASLASGLQPAELQQVSTTATVEVSAAEVASNLAATPTIPPVESGLLGGLPGASFPQPVAFSGDGLEVGDQRSVDFTGGGRLVLEITESEPGRVSFVPVLDTTAIGSWVTWRQVTFTWGSDTGLSVTTDVKVDVYYRRLLEPGWYFGPIVDAGMNQAAHHLLHHLVVAPGVTADAAVGQQG